MKIEKKKKGENQHLVCVLFVQGVITCPPHVVFFYQDAEVDVELDVNSYELLFTSPDTKKCSKLLKQNRVEWEVNMKL